MGILYLVSTPIGNLSDISKRAIDILSSVKYIVCEDTRRTGQLFNKLGIAGDRVFISYYDQIEYKKIPYILNLLNQNDVALTSDAGTPLISDPGYKLVKACFDKNVKVIAVPGASAVLTSLLSSGLPANNFWFIGFLPDKEIAREKLFKELLKTIKNISLKSMQPTIIFYEAPHRFSETLRIMQIIFGDINISVSRELTKIHEETMHDKISGIIKSLKNREKIGELTVLFHL